MKIVDKTISIPFFIRIWECKAKTRDIVNNKKLKFIEVILLY